MISLTSITKYFNRGSINEVLSLDNISLDVNQGDFVAIIGASGSGKSTMMNLVGCLDTPSKGSIILKSKDISHMTESDLSSLRGKTVGFIFQQYNLMPTLSAYKNVILPLELQEY